ncbi:MAG: SDR family oxidoreductase [Bacteroidales bacterium]|nr:SDR family oxidoreductase [Bacteroidales bacterium]
MKVLLTGSTGYIGRRLLPELIQKGHEVVCCVRDKSRVPQENIWSHPSVELFEVDFLKEIVPSPLLHDVEAGYYLIHSMSDNIRDFQDVEAKAARQFLKLMAQTNARQIIYLTGMANEKQLSKHLASRKKVEDILGSGSIPLTALRAGVILGSGSASFEIIRDLVEKLPVMVTPKWLKTPHQPIAIRDVLQYLVGVLNHKETFGKSFDIGGPDILTYKEMLLQFAEVRDLKRYIFIVPVMTPRLSSYWLYFVTSTSYRLATNLVNSMKTEVVARDNSLGELLNIESISYKDAVRMAFQKIEQNNVASSWKDALVSSYADNSLLEHIKVPTNGCFFDKRRKLISGDPAQVLANIWQIGGERGWYYGDWLWHIRGVMDKFAGGVGLRRGRTNPKQIYTGDTLDFWRVLAADKQNRRLLLYAEMKLPGEAWLSFEIEKQEGQHWLVQQATFRPKGLAGRLYWYAVMPFHFFVFDGMANNIIRFGAKKNTA